MRLMIIGFVFLSFNLFAGKVTIEKKETLIRNELFDAKRARAKEYREREALRRDNNEEWSTGLNASCGLWRNRYLVYLCANNRYYKGYEVNDHIEYRELSKNEVKQLKHNEK
jgi:hypothetical protein